MFLPCRHRLAHGLQTLLSYTWTHSIDDASSDAYIANVTLGDSPSESGSSDYDIRQTFSCAVTYNIPGPGSRIWKSIFGNWSTDSIVYARTAPPSNVVTGQYPLGVSLLGTMGVARPDLVSGVPLWTADPRSRRKGNQSSGIHDTHHGGARRSGKKCSARIRRYAGRFGAAQAVHTPGAGFAAGQSGSFQHLQRPQFRPPHQLYGSALFGHRLRCWERRLEAAARVAASIRCIKLAERDPCNCS